MYRITHDTMVLDGLLPAALRLNYTPLPPPRDPSCPQIFVGGGGRSKAQFFERLERKGCIAEACGQRLVEGGG